MVNWPASEEPSQTAFNVAFGTQNSYFDEIAKSPARVQSFGDAIGFFCTIPGFEPSQVIKAYDWGSLGEAVVVDVGRSSGAVALEIVKAFPSTRAVVQDLPEVIGNAPIISKSTASERLNFETRDFFGHDVYFFRMVLHDWSDDYCV